MRYTAIKILIQDSWDSYKKVTRNGDFFREKQLDLRKKIRKLVRVY